METVGRILWLWDPVFRIHGEVEERTYNQGRGYWLRWLTATPLVFTEGCGSQASSLFMVERRAPRRPSPPNHVPLFPTTCLLTGGALMQAGRKRILVAPLVDLGVWPFPEGKEGRREPLTGPFGYSFPTFKQKLDGPLVTRIDSFVPDGWRVRWTFLRPHLFLLQLEAAVPCQCPRCGGDSQ